MIKKAILAVVCFLQFGNLFVARAGDSRTSDSRKGRYDRTVVLATTTSVEDSGLLDFIVPVFKKKHGCKVKVIAVGTGQVIRLGRDGNADILFVHDRQSEEEFVRDGFGTQRHEVMYNYFVIIGPGDDPAGIKSSTGVVDAFEKIARKDAFFVSRGDNSGTHKRETLIWEKTGDARTRMKNYMESGSGMELTLRIADEKRAYCLTDKSTWLHHAKKLQSLALLFDNDTLLYNPYSLIPVSPEKFPRANHGCAKKFVEFLTGNEGKGLIKEFGEKIYGGPLFYPITPGYAP
ncbi:MAG: substrate-binding domain-containing protein [Elusimicrobiota bacterium]